MTIAGSGRSSDTARPWMTLVRPVTEARWSSPGLGAGIVFGDTTTGHHEADQPADEQVLPVMAMPGRCRSAQPSVTDVATPRRRWMAVTIGPYRAPMIEPLEPSLTKKVPTIEVRCSADGERVEHRGAENGCAAEEDGAENHGGDDGHRINPEQVGGRRHSRRHCRRHCRRWWPGCAIIFRMPA